MIDPIVYHPDIALRRAAEPLRPARWPWRAGRWAAPVRLWGAR